METKAFTIMGQFVVTEIHADYLGCIPFTPLTDQTGKPAPQKYDPNFTTDQKPAVYIVKPHLLQQTPWQGKTVTHNSQKMTFNYTGVGTRTVSGTMGNKQQAIVPDYFTGDIIVAASVATGLCDPGGNLITLMDMNTAARHWSPA